MASIIETAVSVTEAERKAAAEKYPGPTEFVHLHNHTLFSPLDGIATPQEYFEACSELGNPAFSITDHGSMASIPDGYIAAAKSKIKFIPGCEIYFSQGHLELMELRKDSNFKIGALRPDYSKNVFTVEDLDSEKQYYDYRRNRHLSVLAKDMVGYRNLIHMTTEAWRIGFYYKPRIWFEQIEKYHEGLIILSGCLNGPICHNLRQSAFWRGVQSGKISSIERNFSKKRKIIVLDITKDEAKCRSEQHFKAAVNWIERFRDLLGDRFYLEMQMPGDEIPFGKEAFHQVALLSEHLEIPAVLTNDCHYLSRKDFKVQKCMMAIDQGLSVDDPNLFHCNSDEQFFKSRAQLRETYYKGGYDKLVTPEKFEKICDNTVKLADKCTSFSPDLTPKLPHIDNANEKLLNMMVEGLKSRGLYDNPDKYIVDGEAVTYKEQAFIEFRRYSEKGFASYFLIIKDLLDYSKSNKWDVGPGRGSAGGSLICYLIGIHSIDPLAWGLSSVRFMGDSRGGKLLNVKMD